MKAPRSLLALVAAGALVLTACAGTKSEGENSGTTEDTIKLGVLTDLSGPFLELSEAILAGNEMWVDEINAAGGVCDRDIELVVRDHGYDADAGIVAYQELEPQVLGFMHVLGSPINAALDQQFEADQSTVVALSWSSFILKNPYIIVPGTTFDVEMINGLSFLMDQGVIKAGDAIGHIYLEGEYGENGLLGAEYFAAQHDLRIEKIKVLPTDSDLRNAVTGLKGKGVKAIALTTTPAQALNVAVVNKQVGLDVPIVGNNPTFGPTILTDETAAALENLYVVASSTPFTSSVPKAQEIAATFKESGADSPPHAGVPYGYAIGEIWGQLLASTCDDLTREGVKTAKDDAASLDTQDLVAELDFSHPGSPATRAVYVAVPDIDTPGGLDQQGELFVSKDAEAYRAPEQQD